MNKTTPVKPKILKMPSFWLTIVFGVLAIYTVIGALFGTTENAFIVTEDQLLYGALPFGLFTLTFLSLTIIKTRAN